MHLSACLSVCPHNPQASNSVDQEWNDFAPRTPKIVRVEDLVKKPPAKRRRILAKSKDPAGGVPAKAKSAAGTATRARAPAPSQDAIPTLGCPKCRHSAKGCAKCRGNRKRVLENLGLDEAAAEGMAATTSAAVEDHLPPVNVADLGLADPDSGVQPMDEEGWGLEVIDDVMGMGPELLDEEGPGPDEAGPNSSDEESEVRE